jgi:hypothetical protein
MPPNWIATTPAPTTADAQVLATMHGCDKPPHALIREGPYAHANWRAAHQLDRPLLHLFESAVYCDVRVMGELCVVGCPYYLLNTVPLVWTGASPAHVYPMVMRVQGFLEQQEYWTGSWEADNSRYANITIEDEIACLLSLVTGRRMKAGECVREYRVDPIGSPRCAVDAASFLLSAESDRSTLPRQREQLSLGHDESVLLSYPDLRVDMAMALLRSARLYRDAISIGEREPELSWLLLVSAIETAANHWHTEPADDAVELLERMEPGFFTELSKYGEGPTQLVADKLAHTMRASAKFMKFLQTFRPQAPEPRPRFGKMEWSWGKLRDRLRRVYEVRSEALHSGVPVPHPMCQPVKIQDGLEEVLIGGQSSGGGVWDEKMAPMYLHVFEYIVRKALVAWWRSVVPDRVGARSPRADGRLGLE